MTAGRAALVALVLAGAAGAAAGERERAPHARHLLLITLDTTRADALGAGATPVLDALAASGTSWSGALAPAPLTLPAHASLLTGLEPPAHGLRDNGGGVLPAELPTLATRLAGAGWQTGAVVASRVLDRRFGLGRGFAVYDDRMLADRIGEYGYPERPAREVVDAALAWLVDRDPARPFFLWVHFYDPHAPYRADSGPFGSGPRADYLGEVAAVDRELGRLLGGLGPARGETLVAVAGDHGESLGEQGEAGHGLLLHEGVLRVPLFVAGPGVRAGRTIAGPVAAWRLAPTLLTLLGHPAGALGGRPLPVGAGAGEDPVAAGVRSETELPRSAYGWSALTSWTSGRHRLVRGARLELFDLLADPGERRDLAARERSRSRALLAELEKHERSLARRSAPAAASGLEEQLAALGYLSGASRAAGSAARGGLDPRAGLALLAELEGARAALDAGRGGEALATLERLVQASPGNVPFLNQLARARLAVGDRGGGIAALREAARAHPGSEFAHLNLAEALEEAGLWGEAEAELRLALALDPLSLRGRLGLARLLAGAGRPEAGAELLREGERAGLESAAVAVELARYELARGDLEGAEREIGRALALAPEEARAWRVGGEIAERRGDAGEAARRYHRAAQLIARASAAPRR